MPPPYMAVLLVKTQARKANEVLCTRTPLLVAPSIQQNWTWQFVAALVKMMPCQGIEASARLKVTKLFEAPTACKRPVTLNSHFPLKSTVTPGWMVRFVTTVFVPTT